MFSAIDLKGYNEYEGQLGSSQNGGCGLFINSDLNYIPRKDLDQRIKNGNSATEMKWIEIVEKGTNKIIGIINRHPNKIENDFNLALSKILCKIKKEKKRVIIAGDFNYNLTYTKNEKVNEFITLMYENLCQPCILKPTRIVEN